MLREGGYWPELQRDCPLRGRKLEGKVILCKRYLDESEMKVNSKQVSSVKTKQISQWAFANNAVLRLTTNHPYITHTVTRPNPKLGGCFL